QPFDFLGMIGSRRKRRLIFDGLVEEGIATRERVEEVQCPVGMDIRSVSVNEIAVSIAGQLIQRRAELLSPGFLKRQADPDNRTPAIAVNG
ncbi:MAG TPA: hypothetical protein DCY13_25240, partial [Verrucomicrobiales bacterium]|nr:hypothetical protein [Verrucomicrobiales bacterium]